MDLDGGRIQRHRLDTDAHDLFALQLLEHRVQHATLGPAIHASVNGMPVTEVLGQPAPLATLLGHVEDGVQQREVRHLDVAPPPRQNRCNAQILRFGDLRLTTSTY